MDTQEHPTVNATEASNAAAAERATGEVAQPEQAARDSLRAADAASPADQAAPNPVAAGWHADPFGRYERRWWDGTGWTERVQSANHSAIDPPGIVAAPRAFVENVPAAPITDALQPIRPPKASPLIAWWFGWAVMLLLIVCIIAAAIAIS